MQRVCGCAPPQQQQQQEGQQEGQQQWDQQDPLGEGQAGEEGQQPGGSLHVRGSPSCPVVGINRPMLAALLQRYHEQRFLVHLEGAVAAEAAALVAALMGEGGDDSVGDAAAPPPPVPPARPPCEPWDDWPIAETLAATGNASLSSGAGSDDESDGSGSGSSRKWHLLRRGLAPDPNEYLRVRGGRRGHLRVVVGRGARGGG